MRQPDTPPDHPPANVSDSRLRGDKVLLGSCPLTKSLKRRRLFGLAACNGSYAKLRHAL